LIGITVVSTVILLGVLIFAHEFGHFIVAKRLGVGVLKFSLGFGPKIVGKKIGETEYVLSLLPLGGYVKLLGESPEEELSEGDAKRSFMKQPVWKRSLIVVAGPVFNILLAFVILALVNMVGLPVLMPEVGSVSPDSAAMTAGMKVGDRITAMDGKEIARWDDISKIVTDGNGQPIRITVRRGEANLDFTVTPRTMKGKNLFGEEVNSYKIGIGPSSKTIIERQNPLLAFGQGIRQTWVISKLTVLSLYKLFQGAISPKTLGGPILIAQIAGAQAKEGFIPFFLFMALLSINLAVLNLLPIPVLDGGHLLFYLIETVIRRPLSIRWQEMAQQVGFFTLILLMVFVVLMDIERLNIKYVSDFIKSITG
jgi:regulator of sigma E protease